MSCNYRERRKIVKNKKCGKTLLQAMHVEGFIDVLFKK